MSHDEFPAKEVKENEVNKRQNVRDVRGKPQTNWDSNKWKRKCGSEMATD
jgi:hypothetical protein